MLKIIENSWNFGVEPTSLIKISSAGLSFSDEKEFKKRAGEKLAFDVKHCLQPKSGEEYVHVIALGAHEYYGCNRRGDAFTEDVCIKYHPTFVKNAKWYRHHIHHDPRQSFGVVKLSNYDEKYKRIDLIVALNATKKAADRNNGNIADLELNALYAGEVLPVSMACVVSYDICSGCGNRAKNRTEYCDKFKCVKYGGCQENLGKTFNDGHTLHVKNPDPIFFDISYVSVPADRIAYSIGILKNANISTTNLSDTIRSLNYKYITDDKPVKDADDCYLTQLKREIYNKMLADAVYLEKKIASSERKLIFKAPELDKYDGKDLISASYNNRILLPSNVFFRNVYPYFRSKFASFHTVDVSSCFSDLYESAELNKLIDENPYDKYNNRYTEANSELVKSASFLKEKQKILSKIQISNSCMSQKDVKLSKDYALYALTFLEKTGSSLDNLSDIIIQNKLVV